MKLLILFIVMNIINVVIQTVKSIATIKCGKTAAAAVNAIAYGLYTYIVVLTMCDLSLFVKCLIVAAANFVGVYIVKYFEEKTRRDRLWKVECTIKAKWTYILHHNLKEKNIPHNFIENIGDNTIFNCYCATQKDSLVLKELLATYNAKYFVSESKIL